MNNSQCAMEFTPEGVPSFSDWENFCQESNEVFTNYSHIVGPFEQSENDESSLDVEYLTTLGSKVPNWYWTIEDGWAYEMALAVFNTPAPYPWVISISYGWPEKLTCQSSITNANCTGIDAQTYVTRANTEFQKTNMKRISFVVCSQDEGAPSEANEDCTLDHTDYPLYSIYPCSSPYVTCVSSTTIGPENSTNSGASSPPICNNGYPCALSNHEEPCQTNNTYYDYTTGGGFALWASRPSYQATLVNSYLNSSAVFPPASKFKSRANRGYPDVSACGARILYFDGGFGIVEGTSAATPIFAAVISLLNEWRLNNNKTPLGFLNPTLYTMAVAQPNAFQDIIGGENRCTLGQCCKYGYQAIKGWDAVSGLGTPNYLEMLAYVQTLP